MGGSVALFHFGNSRGEGAVWVPRCAVRFSFKPRWEKPIAACMSPRVTTLFLPLLLAACAASPAPAPVDPRAAARAAQCAEEHPLDSGAALACERARAPRVAVSRPSPRPAARRNGAVTAPAPVVLVLPGAAPTNAGQGLVDYGRQLAAPPVTCTTIGMGAFASTSCR